MYKYQVYCFSYNNESRFIEMNERFSNAGIDVHWITAVGPDDPRIKEADPPRPNPKADGCMFSHLRTLEEFLKSDNDFAIVSEDDVYIRKSFKKDVQIAIDGMKRLDLNMLLLGYLLNYKPFEYDIRCHHLLESPFVFLNVWQETWGTQMYMVNRVGAEEILKKFSDIKETEKITHFAADWTITKIEKNACIYPMLAVEKVYNRSINDVQCLFHLKNEEINFNPNYYF
jgi:GR25 family glycosyltransferase involved in LPS biosynthesis